MAKTFSELQALALQIRDEILEKKNTAPRVGAALLDMIDNTIQNITDINQKLSVFEHACSGFKRVQSESQLPVTPPQDEKALGYLVGKNLYLYVEEGGNAVSGRYFNVGDITGPQGEPGPQGLIGPVGPKGEQGNSGVTGPTDNIEVVNNLDGGESTPERIKVLAAEQGKVLKEKFSELDNNIYQVQNNIVEIEFSIDEKYIHETTGKEASHIDLSCSDFIDIDGLSLSFNCYIFGDACGIALYDENKNIIVSYGQGSDINNVTIITSAEIPNNAKYARFTTATNKKNESKLKIDGHFFNKRIEPVNSYIESVSNVTNKEIALPNNLGVVNDKYFDNKGSVQNYSTSSAGYTITETYIPVKPSHDYSLVNYLSYGYIVFYTADKVLISTVGDTSQSKIELEFTTPENCAYIRTTFNRNKKETPSIINKGASYPIDNAEGTEVEIDVMPAKVWLHNFLGGLKFNTFKNKGYSHIIYYGQSLSDGHVSRQPISTEPLDGCYMLGNSVRNFATNLQPLKSMPDETAAEPPVVGCVNALKNLFDNTSFLSELKLIGTSCGVGGYTIEQLSKNKQVSQGENVYHTRFLKALNNSKTAVGEEPIECSAIVYMQGEANQETREYPGTGIGVDDVQTRDKDEYKALLKKLKEDMQADIMEIYGQKKPPLFFIYQTSVFYSPVQDMPISMAQYEFAQENDDVILLNPHYYCTTAESGGGHLNANGYRWYGEQTAKTIYEVFVQGINFNPIIPKEFVIKKNVLYIYCYVPNPPIVIDTYTAIEVKNYGFNIFKDDVVVGINSVNILNGNIIEITTDADLSTGKIDLSYAGKEQQGRGNIRDSDKWYSFANYVDDTSLEQNNPPYTPVDENGNNYYGKRYPMYNWLSNLFINVTSRNL